MAGRGVILLTGATGFLGRFLLRDLLRSNHRVAVLVRGGHTGSADERVRRALDAARQLSGSRLPTPTILAGDLREPGLGLSPADRGWLARHGRATVHAAASLAFHQTPEGEPQATNTDGTRRLLELTAAVGIREFHHVSTAFVCGDRRGAILEAEPGRGQHFHNDYERSKHEAERLVRNTPGIRATIYRPAVIVGDSRTGYTSSYHGLYRFLELADRLAGPGHPTVRPLPLRLPFRGDEPRNLVPVDWVAGAIARLVGRPEWHGQTFHLTAPRPSSVRDITDVAVSELGLDGVSLCGEVPDLTDLERAFLDGLRAYDPYRQGDPAFDCRNTLAALPDFPASVVDREQLRRLVRFAVRDGWGRQSRAALRGTIDCGRYIERFFPDALARSELARVPVQVTLAIQVRGPGGGRWVCRLGGGRVLAVRRGHAPADVEYRMDAATFAKVVSGRETPHTAFFDRRIEIAGSTEMGLKLAVLFGRFVREFPYLTLEKQRDVAGVG